MSRTSTQVSRVLASRSARSVAPAPRCWAMSGTATAASTHRPPPEEHIGQGVDRLIDLAHSTGAHRISEDDDARQSHATGQQGDDGDQPGSAGDRSGDPCVRSSGGAPPAVDLPEHGVDSITLVKDTFSEARVRAGDNGQEARRVLVGRRSTRASPSTAPRRWRQCRPTSPHPSGQVEALPARHRRPPPHRSGPGWAQHHRRGHEHPDL